MEEKQSYLEQIMEKDNLIGRAEDEKSRVSGQLEALKMTHSQESKAQRS